MEVKIEERTLIKGRSAKLPLIACLLIIMVGCGALQRVSPRMYGSGQPTGREVWVAHSKGIKSIINLRGDHPGRMEWDVERGVTLALDMPVRCHTMPSGRSRTKSEGYCTSWTFPRLQRLLY